MDQKQPQMPKKPWEPKYKPINKDQVGNTEIHTMHIVG